MEYDKTRILDSMIMRVRQYVDDPLVLQEQDPFEDDCFDDPNFVWSIKHWDACRPEVLILLNNWYNSEPPIQTVSKNVDYLDLCWWGSIKNDKTFRKLLWTDWSRALFSRRHALLGNGIPGIVRGSKEGERKAQLYLRAFDLLWRPLVIQLRPPLTYLCGTWGRTVIHRFRQLNVTQVTLLYHPASRGSQWKRMLALPETQSAISAMASPPAHREIPAPEVGGESYNDN